MAYIQYVVVIDMYRMEILVDFNRNNVRFHLLRKFTGYVVFILLRNIIEGLLK